MMVVEGGHGRREWHAAFSPPATTRTLAGFHNEKALTGEADQERQSLQWQ